MNVVKDKQKKWRNENCETSGKKWRNERHKRQTEKLRNGLCERQAEKNDVTNIVKDKQGKMT